MSAQPLTVPATAVREHLRMLYAERALAELAGLMDDTAYAADLVEEIATCRAAYVGAAVTEIAMLRAQLGGPLAR